jgi:arabinogalactan endo-1,4-beta-galactosidase
MKANVAAALLVALCWQPAQAHEFLFGADLSYANEMDDCGAVYRDAGTAKDVYAVFKDHGTNLVRIRLWNNPTWTKYGNLADVERSIRRAKAQGLKVLLDFHYSDDWADADKQIVPAAWAGIKDDAELARALYRYTVETLTELNKAGLTPDMVQVGNEINSELLMPAPWAKDRTINWTRNALLINAGIRAVREATPKARVMLHIAQPENVEPWFAAAVAAGVTDFDVIGISYYSKWSKYSLAGLGGTINRLRYRYPKAQIVVAETAYPWTTAWADNSTNLLGEDSLIQGFRATKEDQEKYLVDVTQTIIANGGGGLIYWAPDWVSTGCRTRWGQGSNWENATLFDFSGNALPAIDYTRHAYAWPVAVTFRFHGLMPPNGQAFYLWGDFLGAKTIAVRLPENGIYTTTIMPGAKIRFQVFDNLELHAKLLAGDKVVNGFAAETIPSDDVTFDYVLSEPVTAQTGAAAPPSH